MTTKRSISLTKTLAILLVITIVAFSGALVYLYGQVSFRDTQLVAVHDELDQQYVNGAKLGEEVNDLNNQIASLNSQIISLQNLKQPNLVTALGCREIPSNSTYNQNDPQTFDHLYITGAVTNQGLSTAYNAGLNVVAYNVAGKLLVNITVPVSYGIYGNGQSSLTPLSTIGPLEIVSLEGPAGISIVHEGLASTWKIIPVYTSTP